MFFVIVLITIIGLFTWLFGKAIRLERRLLASMIVTTIFMNAGNFGLPVVVFAFGEDALGYASIFFVTMAILAYTIGVVIASLGSVTLAQSLLNLLKIPTLYAFIVAISLMYTGFKLPVVLDRTISLLGEAAIPSMLVLLGLQLKSVSWSIKKGPMTFAIVMRLLVSPLVAFLFAPVFGLAGPALQASVLLAAMPTAVFAIVLATEYNAEPSFATAAVTTTLLLSPLTLTPILSILGT
jgi:predicted permease